MKKPTRKLALPRDTVRVLTLELPRVAGGENTIVPQTAEKVCGGLAVTPTQAPGCGTGG